MLSERLATPRDADELHGILRECGLDMEQRLGLSHWIPAYPARQFQREVELGRVHLVEEGEQRVATFTISREPPLYYTRVRWPENGEPALYVARLAVRPARQQVGIGTWCMRHVEEIARDQGCRSVRLDAFEGHDLLLRFYRRARYSEIARERAAGRRIVCFQRALPGGHNARESRASDPG